jgi:hypothetical protein
VKARLTSRVEIGLHFRRHVLTHLYDDSGIEPCGTAIYSLSDPRDLRHVRYVGQTGAPRRRFLEHLNTSRVWLPDERPWWVRSPKLRPLYGWIRELYQDGLRLPVMVVTGWVQNVSDARVAERMRIYECLQQRLPLLNVETEFLGRQLPLV